MRNFMERDLIQLQNDSTEVVLGIVNPSGGSKEAKDHGLPFRSRKKSILLNKIVNFRGKI